MILRLDFCRFTLCHFHTFLVYKMQRDWYNLNRNNSIIDTNGFLTSDTFLEDFWLDNEDVATGVQIIELKSDESTADSLQGTNKDFKLNKNCNWSDNSNESSHKEHSVSEEKASVYAETCKNQQRDFFNESNFLDNYSYFIENYGTTSNTIAENVSLNYHRNLLAKLDNISFSNSDSDENENVRTINQSEESIYLWKNASKEEKISHDTEKNNGLPAVRIYSFKNERQFTNNTFELINIPCQDEVNGLPQKSIEDGTTPKKNKIERVATPIPSLLVPRFNVDIAATLPTVTEVTEPKKKSTGSQTDQVLIDLDIIGRYILKQKRKDSWYLSEQCTHDKTNDIINWMALSPRPSKCYRRYSPKNQNDSPMSQVNEKKVQHNEKSIFRPTSVLDVIEETRDSKQSSVNTHKASEKTIQSYDLSPVDYLSDTDLECIPAERGDYCRNIKQKSRPKDISIIETDPINNPGILWDSSTDDEPKEIIGDCVNNNLVGKRKRLQKQNNIGSFECVSQRIPPLELNFLSHSENVSLPWYRSLSNVFRCCK